MKSKTFLGFIGIISLMGLTLAGCQAPGPMLARVMGTPKSAKAFNVPVVGKPDFVYSQGIYPQYVASFRDAVKKFMANYVSPSDIARFEFGGWTAPDDAQIEIKFFGIKDMKLFKEKILPDLENYLSKQGL